MNKVKSLAMSGLIALSAATATTAFTASPSPAASQFSCGNYPDVTTYVARTMNGQFQGIRCVKRSNGVQVTQGTDTKYPIFAWYGESSSGCTYRHVGQAFYNNYKIIGYASDIYGNGECAKGNFPGNLTMTYIYDAITSTSRIRVTGAWNEEWTPVNSVSYTPLPQPKTCGSYFDRYSVLTNSSSFGLRCKLKVGTTNNTWFGSGNWNGKTYSHLGMRSTYGRGASDICHPIIGQFCGNYSFGSLKFQYVFPRGINVTGAWNEQWR
jgi:hypothetical protein